MATYIPTNICPVCGGPPDAYTYEPDEEQVGYPDQFQMCSVCMCPLLAPPFLPEVKLQIESIEIRPKERQLKGEWVYTVKKPR